MALCLVLPDAKGGSEGIFEFENYYRFRSVVIMVEGRLWSILESAPTANDQRRPHSTDWATLSISFTLKVYNKILLSSTK